MTEENIYDEGLQEDVNLNPEEEQGEKDLKEALKKIKETVREEDPKPSSQLSLRTILGGDLLTTEMVRSQIWLFVLIVALSIVYVAFRYQCQQDMLTIDRMENELKADALRMVSKRQHRLRKTIAIRPCTSCRLCSMNSEIERGSRILYVPLNRNYAQGEGAEDQKTCWSSN